jgi:hypothetical protein
LDYKHKKNKDGKIGILFHNDGFVSSLIEMTDAAEPAVKRADVGDVKMAQGLGIEREKCQNKRPDPMVCANHANGIEKIDPCWRRLLLKENR